MKNNDQAQELLFGKDWEGNDIHIHNEEVHKGEFIDV